MPIPLGMLEVVKRELKNFDIIHLHSLRTIQNVIIHYYAKKYEVPYVLHLHGIVSWRDSFQLQNVFDKIFKSSLVGDASRIIALSNFMVNAIGLNWNKVVVVPNGIDLPVTAHSPKGLFKKKFGIKDRYIVLYVGRIGMDKGLDFLVKSFRLLMRDVTDVSLVILGPDDGYLKRLQILVNELNIQDRVIFTGFLNSEDILAAYRDADVLVDPKPMEEFGLTPFEAILCDTPAIVVEGSGCAEWLNKCNWKYFVKFNDLQGLRNLCLSLFNGVEKENLETAREWIMKNLSWERVVERLESVYFDICGGSWGS